MLSGERYAPASKEDSKVWFAALAAVPPAIGLALGLARLARDWPLFLIWLSAIAEGCSFLVIWFFITKLPGLKSISALALLGWLNAFGAAYYINR